MPGRIIVLYVLLCLHVLTSATGFVKTWQPHSVANGFVSTLMIADFGVCLFMLISLHQRKDWVIFAFRIYIALSVPFTLYFMAISAFIRETKGLPMPWAGFVGGVIASLGLVAFAWYVGRGPSRHYLHDDQADAGIPP